MKDGRTGRQDRLERAGEPKSFHSFGTEGLGGYMEGQHRLRRMESNLLEGRLSNAFQPLGGNNKQEPMISQEVCGFKTLTRRSVGTVCQTA